MQFGFLISLLLHALILGWGLIAMTSARDFKKPETPSIALEIITSDELAQMSKGSETAKELEAKAAKDAQGKAEKEPPKPKVAAAAPPPPPPPPQEQSKLEELVKEAAKPEPPPPEPKPPEQKPPPPLTPPPQEQAKLDDLVKEAAKPEPAPPVPPPPVPPPKPPDPPKAVEKPKPPAPKPKPPPVKVAEAKPLPAKPTPPANKPSSFDEQMRKAGLAADDAEPSPLLDKDPRRQKSAQSTASADPASKAKTAAGTRDGQAARTSQSEMNALAGQLAGLIKACYRAQAGNAVERDELIVKLRFDLGPDGMLKGEPIVLEAARFSLGTQWAVNALKGCQPYRLDPEKYTAWKEWDFTFRP